MAGDVHKQDTPNPPSMVKGASAPGNGAPSAGRAGTGAGRFSPGDVLRYLPADGHHCRQATAIVHENGVAVDTFWGDRTGHVLTDAELATADVQFRLGEYRKLGEHWEHKHEEWMTYAPEDRQRIGSQHQYQSTYYVRLGAAPDLATQIENARDRVADAEEGVRSAQSRLQWRLDDLAELEALAGSAPVRERLTGSAEPVEPGRAPLTQSPDSEAGRA